MLKKNSRLLLTVFVFFDFLFIIMTFVLSRYLVFGKIFDYTRREFIASGMLMCILYFILEKIEFSHVYRFRPLFDIISSVIKYHFFVLTVFYSFILSRLYIYQNEMVTYFLIISFLIFMSERLVIKFALNILRKRGYNYKRYLIVGAGELGLNFYRKVITSDEYGIKVVGFLDDNEDLLNSRKSEYTDAIKKLILGRTCKIESILKMGLIDNVVIALPMYAEEKIIELTNICEKYAVKSELIPDYYKVISSNPSIRMIKGNPLIGIRNVPLENMFNRFIKRIFDITVAIFGLIICLPLFIVIYIIIKTTSHGPVLFKQKRTGFQQKEFWIYKFRTMYINDSADSKQAVENDPRKTPIGDFLRRTNIDELPQLINIIKGEMSIVGPRPHMLVHTEEFYKKYDKYLVRHWVKPGLTGWAQVNGWRGDSDIGVRVKYDIEYIENWSLWFDIKITFLTFFSKEVKNHAY